MLVLHACMHVRRALHTLPNAPYGKYVRRVTSTRTPTPHPHHNLTQDVCGPNHTPTPPFTQGVRATLTHRPVHCSIATFQLLGMLKYVCISWLCLASLDFVFLLRDKSLGFSFSSSGNPGGRVTLDFKPLTSHDDSNIETLKC